MKRVRQFLGTGEEILLSSRRHPINLAKPLAWWMTALASLSLIGAFLLARTDSPLAGRLVAAAVLTATAYALLRVLDWWMTQYVVTDGRVLLISGVLSVRVSSIPLSRVNDLTFTRSLWGRVLGYGDIYLKTAGERAELSHLAHLPKPKEVYRLLTTLLSELDRAQPVSVPAPWPGSRVPGADDTGPLPRVG